MKKPKIRWPAVLGVVISIGGLASHPEILALLPEKAAVIVSAVGVVIQALTKPIIREEHERHL